MLLTKLAYVSSLSILAAAQLGGLLGGLVGGGGGLGGLLGGGLGGGLGGVGGLVGGGTGGGSTGGDLGGIIGGIGGGAGGTDPGLPVPTPGGGAPPSGSCNTGSQMCCNSVQSSTTQAVASLAGILGLNLGGLNIPVGINCSPISVSHPESHTDIEKTNPLITVTRNRRRKWMQCQPSVL